MQSRFNQLISYACQFNSLSNGLILCGIGKDDIAILQRMACIWRIAIGEERDLISVTVKNFVELDQHIAIMNISDCSALCCHLRA